MLSLSYLIETIIDDIRSPDNCQVYQEFLVPVPEALIHQGRVTHIWYLIQYRHIVNVTNLREILIKNAIVIRKIKLKMLSAKNLVILKWCHCILMFPVHNDVSGRDMIFCESFNQSLPCSVHQSHPWHCSRRPELSVTTCIDRNKSNIFHLKSCI